MIVVEAQVPIIVFYYYRHILSFPRFGSSAPASNQLLMLIFITMCRNSAPKSLRFEHPLLTFYLYRANLVRAAPDGVGRFEALGAD